MVQVFLAPTGEYPKSVSVGVGLEKLRRVMTREELALLDADKREDKVRLWGCHKGTASIWNAMQLNDVVLFVPRAIGFYTDYGKVAFKTQNRELAMQMGRTGIWPWLGYEYIFFIKDHKQIRLPKSEVSKVGGWHGSPPQRFMRVASQQVADGIITLVNTAIT